MATKKTVKKTAKKYMDVEEIEAMQADNETLKERCKKLEAEIQQHVEMATKKAVEAQQLNKIIQELQTSLQIANGQTAMARRAAHALVEAASTIQAG